MSSQTLACFGCKRVYQTRRALTQHQRKSVKCQTQSGPFISLNVVRQHDLAAPNAMAFSQLDVSNGVDAAPCNTSIAAKLPLKPPLTDKTNTGNLANKTASLKQSNVVKLNEEAHFANDFMDDEDDDSSVTTIVASQPGGISDLSDPSWIRDDWAKYEHRGRNFPPFTKEQLQAIKLLAILRASKASGGVYDEVMQWHFRENGDVHMHEMASSRVFLTRKALYQSLKERYNRASGYGIVNEIVLPSRKTRVRMVTNDIAKVMQSLLTRPENKAKDYLFYDQNPFKRPPKDLEYIADCNTGKCYSETYDALIEDPEREILLPLLVASDGTALGQFSCFELTRFQIALGILTREAREKEYNWGTLGWIPNIPSDKSHSRRAFVDSGHADSTRYGAQLDHDEGLIGVQGDIHKAQDLHHMLSYVLKGLKELQKTGFIWDLYYNGRLYKDVLFRPFVAFMRVDTKEADIFCASYQNRNVNVAHLCRECHCPTSESDDHLRTDRAKTQTEIAKLVRKKDQTALRAMSQHYISNAFYEIQFGFHNEMGVHGACPMEMLHAVYLGIFKRVRDVFFEQVGATGKIAEQIDVLATLYGELHGRQSDREWPNTRFPKGIRAGKLNGKKYTGVLLCLLSAIRCEEGRNILEKRPKWRELGVIDEWIMLLETLLEWQSWLNSAKMMKSDVQRAKQKHRYIMYLVRKVASRKTGMGLKLMKFHGILHMAEAILNFGVPLEYDTGCNESHHIDTKKASQLTQKDLAKVEEQTAERMLEMEILALAQAEIGGKWLCDYRIGGSDENDRSDLHHKTRTLLGGTAYYVRHNGQTGKFSMQAERADKKKVENLLVEDDLCEFVIGLEAMVNQYLGSMPLYSCYTRNGHIFRGDFNYRGNVWRDWVVVNWGRDGKLPNRIYGFVDLRGLPDDLQGPRRIKYGGIGHLKPAIYGIVEATVEGCENLKGSELFDVLSTEVGAFENGVVSKLKFYLADVDTFEEPCVVVPNVGGPNNSYFWLEPKARWAELFVQWLRSPHKDDEQENLTAINRLEAEEKEADEW